MAYTPAQVASINAAREAAYNAGQNPYNGAGATAVSSSAGLGGPAPASNYNDPNVAYQAPMTSDSLSASGTTPITLPKPTTTPTTAPTLTSILAGLQSISSQIPNITPDSNSSTSSTSTTGSTPSDSTTNFTSYLANLQAPAKTADIYNDERAADGIDAKQSLVNNLTASLNSIKADADAKKLSTVGQGRGIPEAIIGGQQAEIDREAAIQSLPVAAQLAAAQGDLKLAQDHLDTVFKLRSEDAANETSYKNNLVTAVYNFADKQEQEKLDALKTTNNQAFTLMTNNLNYAQTLATKAIDNHQPDVATRIAALDPKSPTYATDIARLAGQIVVQKTATTGTEAERNQAKIDAISGWFQPGKTVPGTSTQFISNDQFATYDGWKAAIANSGISRKDFITQYGYLINHPEDPKSLAAYGITPAEAKLVNGS